MFQKLRMAGLSALIGLGTLMALPAGAQADNLYFGFGIGSRSGDHVGREIGRSHRAERNRHQYRSCSARQAVRKAERFGMRRARVVDVNRRTIRVAGRIDRGRSQMVFARARGCPVVRW